ncbi:LamG-like jellyroll fold domain-containing protein [Flavobacterium eburneipallidum]|uniref:LamG-like jellyroll fold domain-containing protein n=1 Tax=Flavobacterium eburneipallidum TaxID=3003263 RepID=UPI0024825EBC|nr:LamG-like jellyroll fold domain-containing protein [Flavobacterium eburneipallidum]
MKRLLLFIAITFIGTKANAQAVAEYNFNNSSYADVNGNNPFATGSNIAFTTDRHGNANGALALNAIPNAPFGTLPNGTNATIPNLPIGNQARTISFWISCNNTLASNYYFSYGSAATNSAYGLGQFTTTTSSGGVKPTITTKDDLNFFGYGNDLVHTPYKTNPTSWTHFVVTYTDADVATIYINGTLTASATKVSWNTTNSVFRLGQTMQGTNSVIAYYDDLKIYNRALSSTEISALYTNNSIAASPIISSISENASSATSSTINYTLNAKDLPTTSVINYGTGSTALTNQITAGTASGGLDTATSGVITGLNSGTTYYYQIVATNSAGSTTSAIRSFTQINPSTAIAEYNFDNSYNNIYGNTPFAGSGLTFDYDRFGNPAKALRIASGNNNGATATIANLPIGNAARTVSVWILQPTVSTDNYVFRYGSLAANSVYGLSNQGAHLVNFGYANDLVATNQVASGANWVHVVTTFDGATARIYRNGVQVASGNKASWNTLSGIFILGKEVEIYIDDLKIYNRAISASEVSNLYTNNSILNTPNFQTKTSKATIYPNPTSDNFTIEMENEVKTVEIYSLLGQKILTATSKNINISNVSKGVYLVRIEDSNNTVSTQKLIIE